MAKRKVSHYSFFMLVLFMFFSGDKTKKKVFFSFFDFSWPLGWYAFKHKRKKSLKHQWQKSMILLKWLKTIARETSPRGQQSRASGNDKQKFLPQGRAICIDTMSIQYWYNIGTVLIQYNTQYTQKYPKIPKNIQKYQKIPEIPRNTQKYPKILKNT